jgi:cell division protein FtsQ
LVLNISEHEPVARWGEKAMLDGRGERFTPDHVAAFSHLPVLYGPAGMEHDLLRVLKQLDQRLETRGLRVASLDLSKRRAWTLRLVNGLEIYFGRREPVVELERFLVLVGKLGENRLNQLQRVDLRYRNGFAIVWRPELEGTQESRVEPSAVIHLPGKAIAMALKN